MPSAPKLIRQCQFTCGAFNDIFRGTNADKLRFKSEMDAVILMTVRRFICTATSFANHRKFAWGKSMVFNASNINKAVVQEYDRLLLQWGSDQKMTDAGAVLPKHKLAQKNGYKEVIDEEMELTRMIQGYSQLNKGRSLEDREGPCKSIIVQIAALVGALCALVDGRILGVLGDVKGCLTAAVINSTRQTTVDLASNEQKSKIMNALQQSKMFTTNVLMEWSVHNTYVIRYEEDAAIVGYIIIDRPIHMAACNQRDAVIEYIETIPGHRRASLARSLLDAIKFTAKENGYRCLHVPCLSPTPEFWRKCGFETYFNHSGFQNATCNLDPMSLRNILN